MVFKRAMLAGLAAALGLACSVALSPASAVPVTYQFIPTDPADTSTGTLDIEVPNPTDFSVSETDILDFNFAFDTGDVFDLGDLAVDFVDEGIVAVGGVLTVLSLAPAFTFPPGPPPAAIFFHFLAVLVDIAVPGMPVFDPTFGSWVCVSANCAEVPEPGTALMLALALGGLGASGTVIARRRRRSGEHARGT